MKKILFVLVLALAAIANAQAQDPQARRIFSTTTVASDIGILETGGGVQYHQIIWNVSGSVPTCTVSLDSSTDGITWSTGGVIAGQTCTSNGASTVSALTVANYVRINVTTKSGAGIVTVTYLGYTAVPGGGGGTVTAVTGNSPITSSGGTTPAISCATCVTGSGGGSISLATGQVGFGVGTNQIGGVGPSVFGSPQIFWDNTNDIFSVTSNAADSTGKAAVNVLNISAPSSNVPEQGIVGVEGAILTATTSGTLFGVEGETDITGGFATTGVIAGVGGVSSESGGSQTATELAGFYAMSNTASGAATTTNSYGFHSVPQAAGGTRNAAYFADDQTNGATNYALYMVGGKNFLGGTEGTEFGGPIKLDGSSSGAATIACVAACGSTSALDVPSTDPTIFHSFLVSNVTGGSNVTSWAVPGVSINAQTGTSYSVAASSSSTLGDRGSIITDSNSGATAITLPQAGTTGYANNFNFGLFNINTGLVTITPTTSTINGNATQIVPNHWGAYIYSDNTNYHSVTVPDIAAFPSCADSGGNHLNFTTATGVFSCGTSSSGGSLTFPVTVAGTTTSGGIPYFSSTTVLTSSAILNSNILIKGGGAGGAPTNSSITDNGTTVTTPEELDVGTAGGTMGIRGFLGATAESFNLTGRAGVGIPVPYFTPRPTTSAIALDLFPHGSPSDFSASTGVAWNDTCSTDIVADGTDYECLRVGKWSTGTNSSAGQVSMVAGGTGTVRNLILQSQGGGVSVGTTSTPPSAGLLVSGHTTFEGVTSTGATGTGNLVYSNTPTLTTPALGAATATSVAVGTSPPTCAVGTAGALCENEGTAPTGVSAVDDLYADSTGHCIDILNATANMGCALGVLRATMTADWTCGTGGTVSSCTTATIVGSTGTPMTITLPSVALSWDFDCDGVVGSATGDPANNWNLITATNGATNVTASYMMGTAAAVGGFGATTDQGSTTTTFNIGGTWTLGATGTKFPFHIHARIEGASASGTVVSLQLVDPTVGDLLTIYRGMSCWAHQ